MENELNIIKKELANNQLLQEKRHMYLCRNLDHTNRVLNKIIDKFDDNELKKSQIGFIFRNRHGNVYDLNIDNPKTFNEKLQWLSLNYYYENELIHQIGDKYQFKDYIKQKLGDGYTIPLLGKWDSPKDIDYSALPNQFVLKSTWGGDSRQVKIIKNKNNVDYSALNAELEQWLDFSQNAYYYAFNGAVKNIKPAIIAEEYVEEIEQSNHEFKIFCFNGEPKLFYTANYDIEDHSNKFFAYYDLDFNRLPFINGTWIDKSNDVQKPTQWYKMLEISKILSKNFPFVRVDFYLIQEKIYLGELTFLPGGGLNKYTPTEWDYKMGEMLDIRNL